jgi:hypothetical protein
MLFVQPSRLASRQPVLRDSLGFPNRMYERCWRRMNRSGEVDGVRFLARSGGTPCMRLFTATRARRSTRRPRQSVSKLRDVVAGVLPCVAAPLELLYATSRNGKISPPVVIFSLTWSRRETRRETRSSSYISGSTNMTGALIAPVLRPFGGDQLTTALNAFHSEAGTTIGCSCPHHSLRASRHVGRRRNTNMAAGLATVSL